VSVAIATCRVVDIDPDAPLLLAALAAQGVHGELAAWDDERVDWSSYDLVVIRSTWDYTARRDQFLAWAKALARLENPYPVLEYSSDKHYLADLIARGHRVVPSTFVDVGREAAFPDGDFVVKPCVGAGSMDAERYGAGEHEAALRHVALLHERGRDALVQPYVSSVDEQGERGLVFVDGQFGHAMTKNAMLNTPAPDRHHLFRHEQMSKVDVDPEALRLATDVLADLGFDHLLYARVDLVADDEGWLLMELELVEPSLYLSYDEGTARHLAAAIKRRVDHRSRPSR
jgi:glutathione synthase/RimK-type ligase-like ATP-grasp enzyme